MKKVNLHELIELPHGVANKELENAGHFRDSDMKEYQVEVRGFYRPEEDQHIVTVTAPNEDAALAKACDQTDFDEITYTKILSITDIEEGDL